MRSGKLTHPIAIERRSTTVDENGTPLEIWVLIAELRAEIVQASTEEFLRSFGAEVATATVFRVHYLAGITPADRVIYQGRAFDVKEVRELGRRRGLEIRAVAR